MYMPYLMCGYAATLALMFAGFRLTVANTPGMRGAARLSWLLMLGIAGLMLIGLRTVAPAWLSVLAGNELIFISTLLFYCTAADILKVDMGFLPWGIGVLAAAPVAMGYFTYFHLSLPARIVIGSGICAIFDTATAILLFRNRGLCAGDGGDEPNLKFPTVVLAWLQALTAFQLVLRALFSTLYPPAEYIHLDLIQVAFSYAYMVLSIASGCGLIWLALCIHRQELHVMAQTDPLTGLLNRRAFEDLFARELRRAHRAADAQVLLLLDIDRFKSVNDTWGHQAGDEVLRCVCRTLQNCLRPSDVLSRFGGEEFIVLLRNAGAAEAQDIAERLRTEVSQLAGLPGPAQVTVSIGVALSRPDESSDEFFRRCDEALYQSKRRGRNLVTLSDSAASQPGAAPQSAC